MLALGAGLRGVEGIRNLVGRRMKDDNEYDNNNAGRPEGPVFASVPYYAKESRDKHAQVTKRRGLSWYMPGLLLGGGAGAYGGYKLMDMILDRRRRQEADDELEHAREEFSKALLGEPQDQKTGSAGSQADSFDVLFDRLQKKANLSDLWGTVKGIYGSYALLSSLLTGLYAYKKFSGGTDTLEEARKRRLREQYAERPSEVFAVPTPVRRSGHGNIAGEAAKKDTTDSQEDAPHEFELDPSRHDIISSVGKG